MGKRGKRRERRWWIWLSLSRLDFPNILYLFEQLTTYLSKGAEKKEFKISDMDEWEGSDDGLDTDEEKVIEMFCHSTESCNIWLKEKKDDSDDDGKGKKRSKDTKKKSKKKEVEDEAFDDSEDDDRQDREVIIYQVVLSLIFYQVDYMSDESSDSEEEEEEKADARGQNQV